MTELSLIDGPRIDGDSAVVAYGNADWKVSIRAVMYVRVDGPVEMTIALRDTSRMSDDTISEGITTGLLRAIPMRDVRRQLNEVMLEAYQSERLESELATGRFGTDRDYALLANEFARRVNAGDPHPIRSLAQQLGVGRTTISARVRTARAKGLLTPEDPGNPGTLTDRGRQLLESSDG